LSPGQIKIAEYNTTPYRESEALRYNTQAMAGNAGIPLPPVPGMISQPGMAEQWQASVNSGLAQTASDKWGRMYNFWYDTGIWPSEDFTQAEIAWFRQWASPEDKDRYNYMYTGGGYINKGGGSGANGPSGGSGADYVGGGRAYASSYGSTYGLINWRL
jgi:hypothetical protein